MSAEHHRRPHLRPFARQPIVFLTVVTAQRRPLLANQTACAILANLWGQSAGIDGWFVGDYLLMPDHVHLFARAALDCKPLAVWMKSWKSVSARRLRSLAEADGPFWQRDYFDRFLRSADNYSEKWDYVAMNPVREALCARPEDWPWRGRLFDLQY